MIGYNNPEKRDFFIQADSNESMSSWMETIRKCTKKPISPPPEHDKK